MPKKMLPWIDLSAQAELDKLIDKTIIVELKKRFWGDKTNGSSAGGGRRLVIYDFRGLMLAIGTLRYFFAKHNTKLFYRGQTNNWELKPNLFRNLNTTKEWEENLKWNRTVLDFLKDKYDNQNSNEDFREALLQHYGFRTTWFDVVDHIQTACWFACNGEQHFPKESHDNRLDGDVGYIYLMCVPNFENRWVKYIDLRQKPAEWLRPHTQQAFAIRQHNPLGYSTKLDYLCVLTFIVPKKLLWAWSNSEYFSEEIMYPNYAFDRGLKHYEEALKKLSKAGIPIIPPCTK